MENRPETRPDAEERISLELSIGESLHDVVDDAGALALATPPRPPTATPPRHPKANAEEKARQPPAKATARPSQRSPAANASHQPPKATAKMKAYPPPPKAQPSPSTAEAETDWRILAAAAVKAAAQGAVVIAIVIAMGITIIP